MYIKEKTRIISAGICLIWALIFVLGIYALLKYPGRTYIFILFSIVANSLLYFGFRKNAIFFDTFIGIFFWLGFWLKLTIRVGFMNGLINQGVSYFDGSGAAYDRALLVSTCGMTGLLAASYLRERLGLNYPKSLEGIAQPGLHNFYVKNRRFVLSAFLFLVIAIAFTNAYLGVYQRGEIPRTVLPYGLGGVYTWLLLFGLASISALILRFEYSMAGKTTYPAMILSLLESFFSNISLLSRGMLLNVAALVYGSYKSVKTYKLKTSFTFVFVSFLLFIILFGASVYSVNFIRSSSYLGLNKAGSVEVSTVNKEAVNMTTQLLIDRWVGLEGVTAVSSYSHLGWNLWKTAWNEKYSDRGTSFYDKHLIVTPYQGEHMSQFHFISLPGIIAFLFYPGSYLFLFVGMFVIGFFAASIEFVTFRLGGKNLFLCALLAQVVAFRLMSFGYVPTRSYILFSAIFFNLAIIYFLEKCFAYRNKRVEAPS